MLCPECFIEKNDEKICPSCGFNEGGAKVYFALPYRTLLDNRYMVGRILGNPGGFGITYLGWDVRLHTKVAIKEYLPRQVAARDNASLCVLPLPGSESFYEQGRQQFLREARTLAQLVHANIVRVRNYFEANDTAYMVMDYCKGINLADYLRAHGGVISQQQTISLMNPILDALREVHDKGFLHRDIKPTNIYIAENGTPILLDFGSARAVVSDLTQSPAVSLTPGFAAYEQYLSSAEQGPWTDVYGCAATIYYMLSGIMPPQALERIEKDGIVPLSQLRTDIAPDFDKVLMQGMAARAQDRIRDINTFQRMLSEHKNIVPTQFIHQAIPKTQLQINTVANEQTVKAQLPNSANNMAVTQFLSQNQVLPGKMGTNSEARKQIESSNAGNYIKNLPRWAGIAVAAGIIIFVVGGSLWAGARFSNSSSKASKEESSSIQQVAKSTEASREASVVAQTVSTGTRTETKPNADEMPPNGQEDPKDKPPPENKQVIGTYKNERFGYSIECPSGFSLIATNDNGGAAKFTSADKQADLTLFGNNHNPNEGNTKRFYKQALNNVQGEVGYNVAGETWFVVTWKNNRRIYYEKVFVGERSRNGFVISFPEERKNEYEEIVNRLEASFHRGDTAHSW